VRFSENGLKFPSFGLFATEKTIAAKHDQLKRFVSVVAGCWSYIFNGHEDEGVKAIIAARPQSKLDPKVLRQQIDTLKDYALTEAVKSLPFGSMALGDWQQAVGILSEGGLLGQTVEPKDLFTNDLIDPKIVADVGASLK
jgi:NitT/TauT family transport system substrate-binding protein